MAFLDSTTAIIDAVLTTKGREALAKNDGSFKITKFAFGDDEINYQLYDASASDPDNDINRLPILEPVSNESIALNYRLVTLARGSLKVSTLTLNPNIATVDFGTSARFVVSTENGDDPQGYKAVSRDTDIGSIESQKVLPDDSGEATFTVLTGTNAGSKSGLVNIDVTGVNSGARATYQLTVSASGT